MNTFTTFSRSVLSSFACFCLSAAYAQQAPVDEIEEIVVLADYRGRPASEIPASVTILDERTINGTAIQHFEELINGLPNLNWSGDGHRARYIQIRGVGELAQYQGAPNPSVGLIIDDIDFSGIGTIAELLEDDNAMARVEALTDLPTLPLAEVTAFLRM